MSSARARGQRGETLLELLLTVSIMGTAFIGVLAGIGTTLTASDTQRQTATAETVLRSYAERMKDPVDVPYVDCATTASYAAVPVGFTLPNAGWTATVTTVTKWQGDSPPTFSAPCSPDKGVQQLTLQVKSPAGAHQAIETIVIAKRKP
jgi:type II secretory pathway pseudopilin PulG